MGKRNLKQNAVQTAAVMMVMTLMSKLLGFTRELIIAGAFGTSYVVDAYVLAQSIPGALLGGLLASIGTAFIPVYSELVETRGREAGHRYTSNIINLTMTIALAGFVLGFFFAEQIAGLFTGAFSAEAARLTVFFLRVTFSYAIFSCGASITDAYLQYNGRFYSPVIGGYLYNIGIVVVAVISAIVSEYLLAFGMLAGYLLHMVFNLCVARRCGYRHQAALAYDTFARKTVQLAMPVFFSSCIHSINTFVDKSLAAGLQEGSISALNYGNLLVQLVTGLTTGIVITILYPKLTQAASQKDDTAYQSMLQLSASVLLIITIPFLLGVIAFSEPVVQVVFERGAFDGVSTALTESAFLFYGLGIPFLAISDLMARVCYTKQDTKTPIACAAVSVVVNISMNLLLVGTMGHSGLALATTLGTLTSMVMLIARVRKKHPQLRLFPNGGKILRIALSAVLAVTAAVAVYQRVQLIWMPRLVYLGLAVCAACGVYLVLLLLLKVEEVALLKRLIK